LKSYVLSSANFSLNAFLPFATSQPKCSRHQLPVAYEPPRLTPLSPITASCETGQAQSFSFRRPLETLRTPIFMQVVFVAFPSTSAVYRSPALRAFHRPTFSQKYSGFLAFAQISSRLFFLFILRRWVHCRHLRGLQPLQANFSSRPPCVVISLILFFFSLSSMFERQEFLPSVFYGLPSFFPPVYPAHSFLAQPTWVYPSFFSFVYEFLSGA